MKIIWVPHGKSGRFPSFLLDASLQKQAFPSLLCSPSAPHPLLPFSSVLLTPPGTASYPRLVPRPFPPSLSSGLNCAVDWHCFAKDIIVFLPTLEKIILRVSRLLELQIEATEIPVMGIECFLAPTPISQNGFPVLAKGGLEILG